MILFKINLLHPSDFSSKFNTPTQISIPHQKFLMFSQGILARESEVQIPVVNSD